MPKPNRLIELVRLVGARRGDGEMAVILDGDQPLCRRRLHGFARAAERSAAAAIGGVLHLEDDPARIRHEDLWRPVPRGHEHFQWARRRRTRPGGACDAVFGEHRQDPIDIEVFDGDAEPAHPLRTAGAGRRQRHELRPRTDAQERRVAVTRLNRHPEESLIELERALHIGDGQRHAVEAADAQLTAGLRRQRPREQRDGWKRAEEIAAGDVHGAAIIGPPTSISRKRTRDYRVTA
jgi:hypothetical protein